MLTLYKKTDPFNFALKLLLLANKTRAKIPSFSVHFISRLILWSIDGDFSLTNLPQISE